MDAVEELLDGSSPDVYRYFMTAKSKGERNAVKTGLALHVRHAGNPRG
jgi:hypothetical protein